MSDEAIPDNVEIEETTVEIQETIYEPEPEPEEYFNKERSIALIQLFKKYKPMVAAGSIKTMMRMWEIISVDLTNIFQMTIPAAKCENRFKVLERGYKRMKNAIDSGMEIKKIFPYYEEFKDVPNNKKYTIVPGLNSSNYSEYTAVNFKNTVTPLTYDELPNKDIDEKIEFITIKGDTTQPIIKKYAGQDIYFNKERTLALIKLYKQYHQKYRERTVRTKSRMWHLVAQEMMTLFNIPLTGAKCENKLKVLERSYKRGTNFKARYEFEEELKDIFGPKVKKPTTVVNTSQPSTSKTPQQVMLRFIDPQASKTDKIETILTGIKSDFQIYCRERLNIEREKLALKRQKLVFMKERAALEDQNMSKTFKTQ